MNSANFGKIMKETAISRNSKLKKWQKENFDENMKNQQNSRKFTFKKLGN